jgi:hypothetical protein
MEDTQLQRPEQSEPEQRPGKKNKIRQIFASMSIKEKKTVLLIGFLGIILMFVINLLKIFLK